MKKCSLTRLDLNKKSWPLESYAYIGSDSSCHICIQDESVNARHAKIEMINNKILIKNLNSTTGIMVNGAQILEAILSDGDIITIGAVNLVVSDDEKIKTDFPIKSRCEYWNKQLQSLTEISPSSHTILLLGPSGVGKDLIAQSIHRFSKNPLQPFISVNCSALTESLVESELFGHMKGSFTGAHADRKGAFEAARNGTLFLDEIGELSYNLQAKLLRALENNEIRPVGSDRSIKTNARVIAATHQNLYHKIREGTFRSDLFYRLNVITLEVPSLKERSEDFEDLIYTFAKSMRVRFSYGAIQTLKKYEWPGNIRELKNVVTRAAVLYPKEYIQEEHVHMLLNKKERIAHQSTGILFADSYQANSLPVIKEIEKQMILKRLAANNGNQKLTASDLGMPKSTLHDRIKNYRINPEKFKT